MKNGARDILSAASAAAALIAGGNGAARAEEAAARLAVYANGVLEFCEVGAVRLRDVPYREGTSDPRTRMDVEPAGSGGSGACPDSIPRTLPLPANVSAREAWQKTLSTDGEPMTIRAFIFATGRTN